jgi:hypothetical protein
LSLVKQIGRTDFSYSIRINFGTKPNISEFISDFTCDIIKYLPLGGVYCMVVKSAKIKMETYQLCILSLVLASISVILWAQFQKKCCTRRYWVRPWLRRRLNDKHHTILHLYKELLLVSRLNIQKVKNLKFVFIHIRHFPLILHECNVS